MSSQTFDTREKILQATMNIIRAKGLNAATTRAIASEAGVNEVTVFRHYGSKKGLIKAIIEKHSAAMGFSKTFSENVVWDLEQDLYMFAKLYQQQMSKNLDFVNFMISLKGAGIFPEFEQEILSAPLQLKRSLHDYLVKMQAQGKLIETNLEVQILAFIWMNFGCFFSGARLCTQLADISEEQFLRQSVKVLARGLTP